MTFKDIAKQLTTAVQTVPNLVQILRDGFEQAEAGSGSSIEYSTTERLIGKWIDEKPLYERTWNVETISVSSVGSWVSTSIDASAMESLVDVKTSDNGVIWSGISATIDAGIIKLINTTSQANIGVSKITLQYTKTTV